MHACLGVASVGFVVAIEVDKARDKPRGSPGEHALAWAVAIGSAIGAAYVMIAR